jgi:hypothetical protein
VRSILLCLVLAGCAAPEPPAVPPAPRNCPILPTLKEGAGRAEMLAHIRITAILYARCAATP